jgi:predicted dehydrogenase
VSRGTRIGLVGCGRWGALILRDLCALGCEVTVVARSAESAAAAEQGGADGIVPTTAELPGVDGIVVATPTSTHASVAEEVLGRGVPVFVEKPLADDSEAAERLAEEHADRLFVMDKWRYHAGVEELGAIARSEELGRVIGLRTTRVGRERRRDVDPVWVLAPHDLSIAIEILGASLEPRSAAADSPNGKALGLFGLLGENPWHVLEVSGRSDERRREVVLACEGGLAVLPDGYSDAVRIVRADESDGELRPVSTELPLLRELRAFVEHLTGGPPPRSSAAEGAAIVRTISRLRRLAGLPS